MKNFQISKVGEQFAVEFYRVDGDVDSKTDSELLSACSAMVSYGRVFRQGRTTADVEVYTYE